MMIHEITEKVGRHKARRRVGRGESSGRGKTSGRGHKGAASRAGWKRRAGYEGGQMPLIRRMPKRGFSNVQFATEYHVVNVRKLEVHCDANSEVTVKSLAAAGVIRDAKRPLKVLADGTLSKKLHVSAVKFSKAAREKIESAGGSIIEIEVKKWRRSRTKPAGKSVKADKPAVKSNESEASKAAQAEIDKAAGKSVMADKPAKGEKPKKPAKKADR